MGQLREFASKPVLARLANDLATGKWSMVTNSAETTVLGEGIIGDTIEGSVELERVHGPGDSSVDLAFVWKRFREGYAPRVVATGTLSATWAAVVDRGVLEPRSFPNYLRDYFDGLNQNASPSQRAKLGRIRSGGELAGEYRFETSLEDSNLVGNIYFASYAIWQGRALDRALYETLPSAYGRRAPGEFRTAYSKVVHLRESRPFEPIVVRVYVDDVTAGDALLSFDYYRMAQDEGRIKIATGENRVEWAVPGHDPEADFQLAPFAADVAGRLLERNNRR
jgi:hypothetical protein